MNNTASVRLIQTRTGQPRVIGQSHRSEFIWSSIDRKRVNASMIYATHTGLTGDQPTDSRPKYTGDLVVGQMHGGHEKAIYVYPAGHYSRWEAQIGPERLGLRSFGENLRVSDIVEDDVHIGDIWQLGEVRLQVSKVRTPCQKLATYFGYQPIIDLMARNGLCGWYMRVLYPGLMPTTGDIKIVYRDLESPSVAQRFASKMGLQTAT